MAIAELPDQGGLHVEAVQTSDPSESDRAESSENARHPLLRARHHVQQTLPLEHLSLQDNAAPAAADDTVVGTLIDLNARPTGIEDRMGVADWPAGTAGTAEEAEVLDEALELSVVMPCLNEAETIAACIEKATVAIERLGVRAEIVVADNGSTDGSREIAEALGVRVVRVDAPGYGSALMGGIDAARGRYVIMGDADDSYDFGDLAPFLEKLREGNDLVMGNRFHGDFRPGAMPAMHRYLGTPALTGIERLLFRSPIGDLNCGMRALRRAAVPGLDLRAPGMEFASEMIVKASLRGLRIAEVPTTLSPAGRSRPPHLRAWRDGWRHLRFLLFHSPTWLFLYPGIILAFAGLLILLGALTSQAPADSLGPRAPAIFVGSLTLAAGYQSVLFSCLAKNFAVGEGVLPGGDRLHRVSRRITLELGLAVGFVLFAAGATASAVAGVPLATATASLANVAGLERLAVLGFAAMMLGGQTILSSLLLGVLGLARQ
jgi:glycosyltransferase involved in cell wall biosynthesis